MTDDLIARLEKATGSNTDLDNEIDRAVYPEDWSVSPAGRPCWSYKTPRLRLLGSVPHYTGSLDATKPHLAKLGLYSLFHQEDGPGCSLIPAKKDGSFVGQQEIVVMAPTLELAAAIVLCIASLKAIKARKP